MIVDLARFSNGCTFNSPMKAGVFQNLIPASAQKDLLNAYPKEGFKRCQRAVLPGKLYSFSMHPLVDDGSRVDSSLWECCIWRELVDSILDVSYRQALSEALDIELCDAIINMGLYKFDTGDYVGMHVDREDKIATQIFYFNSLWGVQDGGFLQLFRNNEKNSCFLSLPPLSIYSVAIARDEAAWHAVSPVTELSGQPRMSLQLEYYRR